MIQRIKVYNHNKKMYINDEDNEPAPPGYSTVSKYFHDVDDGTWTTQRFLQLPEITMEQFDLTKEGLRSVGWDEWNTPVATKGGISTEEMGTCTTIGFTGTCNGELYSALYHNVDLEGNPKKTVVILRKLQSLFNGDENLPSFDDLDNVRFFAMGGHIESSQTCWSIKQTFRQLNLDVIGVTFKTSPGDQDLVKAVLVDSNGNVKYATFLPKKKEEKKPDFGGFGFTSAMDLYKREDKDKGGSGGFGGFGGFVTASSMKTNF